MKVITKPSLRLGLLLVGILAVANAQADSVTYTGTFSGLTDVTNQDIQVSQFSSSLGALVSASFTLNATMNSKAFAANDGNFYAGWDKLAYSLSLTGADSLAISAGNPATRLVGTGSPDQSQTSFPHSQQQQITVASPVVGVETYVAPGSYMWTDYAPTLSASQTFTLGALGDLIGTGNLNFLLTTLNNDTLALGGLQTGGVPPSNSGLSTNVVSNVSVTYTYDAAVATPVPEADSSALMALGMGLVGFLVRRRKS